MLTLSSCIGRSRFKIILQRSYAFSLVVGMHIEIKQKRICGNAEHLITSHIRNIHTQVNTCICFLSGCWTVRWIRVCHPPERMLFFFRGIIEMLPLCSTLWSTMAKAFDVPRRERFCAGYKSGLNGLSSYTLSQLADFQHCQEAVCHWFTPLLKRLVSRFTYLASTGSCCTPNSGDSLSDAVVFEGDKCHSEDGQISVKTTSSSLTLDEKLCLSLCCWFCAVGCFFKRSGLRDCERINSENHTNVITVWIVNSPPPFFADIPFAFLPPTGKEGEMGNSVSSSL